MTIEKQIKEELEAKDENLEVSTDEKNIVETELKVDVSADVAALVEGEELSEEFKTKAATIFEATVVSRVKEEISKLNEDFETRLEEGVNEKLESIVEKVDGYLDYCVEKWISDNEVALVSGIKTDITENFINSLKNVFVESYIDVPEEKADLVSELQTENDELKAKLTEAIDTSIQATKKLDEQRIEGLIMENSKGLSEIDSEKFKGLVKDLVFEDVDSFSEKLKVIRESLFKPVKTVVESDVSTETTDVINEQTNTKPQNSRVASYAGALDTLLK